MSWISLTLVFTILCPNIYSFVSAKNCTALRNSRALIAPMGGLAQFNGGLGPRVVDSNCNCDRRNRICKCCALIDLQRMRPYQSTCSSFIIPRRPKDNVVYNVYVNDKSYKQTAPIHKKPRPMCRPFSLILGLKACNNFDIKREGDGIFVCVKINLSFYSVKILKLNFKCMSLELPFMNGNGDDY